MEEIIVGEGLRKRRGRPLKDSEDDVSASGVRRARVRHAQREFRRRRQDLLQTQQQRIDALENAVEKMSTTFLNFSQNILDTEQIKDSPEVIGAVKDATSEILAQAKEILNDDDEQPVIDVPYPPTSIGERETELSRLEFTDISLEDSFLQTNEPITNNLSSTSRQLLQRSRDSVGLNSQVVSNHSILLANRKTAFMPTTSSFFSREFWGGDYVNYSAILPGESIASHLTFWQKLIRVSLASSYHCLRADPGYSVQRAHHQFKYCMSHRSVGWALAKCRQVLGNMEKTQTPAHIPPTPLAVYFDTPEQHTLGVAAFKELAENGGSRDDFIDAEAVEEYLHEKGLVHDDGSIIRLVLSVPSSPRLDSHQQVNKSRKTRKVVDVDVHALIEKLSPSAICFGDIVGFPKTLINSAIVSSVIRVAG